MAFFERSERTERELKWARIWFNQFAAFHQHQGDSSWEFSADDVIAFSRFKMNQGMPAWKRLKMVQSLISFRTRVQQRSTDDLLPVHRKLQEIVAGERVKEAGAESIEEVVGKINPGEPDVIQQFRRKLRLMGKKYATERAYVGKVKAFMRERGLRCLADFANIGGQDVEAHLTDLAVDGNVAPSTQNQAFHALLFLFEHVFQRDIGRIQAVRASKGKQIPTVLSEPEVQRVLEQLHGVPLVIAQLLYGCGMRISEALRLRVKDVDFENSLIEIHQSKGGKSRIVPLPKELVEPLRRLLRSRLVLHEHDLDQGIASVWLPYALAKKYPKAASDWRWQFIFASDRLSRDPHSGRLHRHHLHRDTFPSRLRRAVECFINGKCHPSIVMKAKLSQSAAEDCLSPFPSHFPYFQRSVMSSLLRRFANFPVARLLTRMSNRNDECFVRADLVNNDVRKSIHVGTPKDTRHETRACPRTPDTSAGHGRLIRSL